MTIHPIIPIWLMSILCVLMLVMKRKGVWNYIRQILIVVILFALNLRIMVPNGEVEKKEINLDVLFVIDNSMSMLAEDFDGNGRRLDAVKSDCEYIMDKLEGSRFSVIEFGNVAYRLTPFTSDTDIVKTAINSMEGQTQYYANGTTLNTPFPLMKLTLEKDEEQEPDRTRIVFFFSDGENTNKKEKLGSFKSAEPYIYDGAVLGYGTEKGGKMKVHSYEGDVGDAFYMQTRNKNGRLEDAISKYDAKNLELIASDLSLDYYHITNNSMIRDIVMDTTEYITKVAEEDISMTKGYAETYYWFAIPLSILLIYEIIYYKWRLKE